MVKNYLCTLIGLLFFFNSGLSQEFEYLMLDDFDLKGKVKSCTVITDYGKEVFDFDEIGRLVMSTTQYNEKDQDITVYKYVNDFLVERRMESYKNGQLDVATSMANFFEIDTAGTKTITEKIVSYDKQFYENQRYIFDEMDRLKAITISHLDAVDETSVEYDNYKNESTKTYFLNGVIQKSIRISTTKKGESEIKTVLTKEFLDGEPNKAVEKTMDLKGRLLTSTFFSFDQKENQFAPSKNETYIYNQDGILSKTIVKRGNTVSEKGFIFQFDDNIDKNWVKKIVTPDNTYTTRKIEYYPTEEAD